MQLNQRKAAIIGCGFVGSATAFCLMQSGLFSEIVLQDVDKDKAEGEAMDITHGTPFAGRMKIYAGNYNDMMDAAVIIITAGANQKEGETRLDLVKKNKKIFEEIIPEISNRDYEGILLIVSNPVDILTYTAIKISGFEENRVIGSGTVLDSARFRYLLGKHLDVDSRSVQAFIIGEHGDSEIAAWSSVNVSGIPVNDFCEMRGHYDHEEAMKAIADNVKESAYKIIKRKKATYYGIAMSVKRICEVILKDEKAILPVSTMMHGAHGIEDIVLSMPAIVGKNGIETQVPIELNEEEERKLKQSARILKQMIGIKKDDVKKVDFVKKGETLSAKELNVYTGGKGLNQSIALARAGVETYQAGAIGTDGMFLLEQLKEAGVKTDLVKILDDVRTGNAIIQNDDEGDNCIVLFGGANQAITKEQVDEVFKDFTNEDYLLIQNEINELSYIVEKAKEEGMKIILNPSPMNEKIMKLPLDQIDYFILNEIEAMQILEMDKPEEIDGKYIASLLHERFKDATIVLTLGSEGSVCISDDEYVEQSIYKVKAIDTTAAGDTYTGYFIAGILNGKTIKESMDIASKASAIAVTRQGAAPSIPVLEAVEEYK